MFGSVALKDEASKTLDKLEKKADGAASKLGGLSKGFSDFGGKAQKIGGSLTKGLTVPIAAVGTAMFAATNKITSNGDEIHKASQRAGIGAESYQELSYWAGQNGLSQNDMEKALGRLNSRIGEARAGNEKYSNAMRQMGVDMKALEDGTLSTEQAFEQSIEGLMKMTNEQDKAALASELFGVKLAREMMPALNDTSLSVEDAKKKAQELGFVMSKEAVDASAAYQDSMDDLKKSFQGIGAEVANKFLPILVDSVIPFIQDKVIPAIGQFADKISTLVGWFSNLTPAQKKFIAFGVALLASIGPVLTIIGKVSSAIGLVMNIATKVGPAMAGVGKAFALLTSPVGLVVAAIAAVVAGFILLYKHSETFRTMIDNVIEKIMSGLETAKVALGLFWEGIKLVFSAAFEALKVMILAFWEPLRDGVVAAFTFIRELVSTVFNAIKVTIEVAMSAIKVVIDTILGAISLVFTTIFNTIKNVVSTVFNAIKAVIETVLGVVVGVVTNYLNAMLAVYTKIFNTIKNVVSTVFNGIKNIITTASTAISGVVTEKFNAVKNAIVKPIEWARDKVKGAVDNIKGLFSGMNLSIPSIKLPKLPKPKIVGGFSLTPPRVPKISWNAKGGIFNEPTIFDTNKGLQGVGEAGAEAIIPISKLKDWMSEWGRSKDNIIESALYALQKSMTAMSTQPAMATAGQAPVINFIINGDWTVDSDERQESVMEEFSREVERHYRTRGDK